MVLPYETRDACRTLDLRSGIDFLLERSPGRLSLAAVRHRTLTRRGPSLRATALNSLKQASAGSSIFEPTRSRRRYSPPSTRPLETALSGADNRGAPDPLPRRGSTGGGA